MDKKIVLRLPQILGEYDYDTQIEPMLDKWQKRLLMNDYEMRLTLFKIPQILGLDYDTELWPYLQAMRERLGLTEEYNIIQVREQILRKPSLLEIPVRGSASSSNRRDSKKK